MIHPTAVIDDGATIAADVEIGAFTVVHAGARIGSGSRIGSHCVIGEPTHLATRDELIIGAHSLVRSHSVLYQGSSFGDGLETGHHATIREGTRAAAGLRVGTDCDVQGDCTIGEHVRLHSGVFVAKSSILGNFCWLFPRVVLTNDRTPPSDESLHRGVTVGDFAVVGASSTVLPGITLGRHSVVGARSLVTRDVAEGLLVRGAPARAVGAAAAVPLADGTERAAYPWNVRFTRGYPDDVVQEWRDSDRGGPA